MCVYIYIYIYIYIYMYVLIPSCIFKSTGSYMAAMNFLPSVAPNAQNSCYLLRCMDLLCAGRSESALGVSSVPNSVTAGTR